jgi:hypothetical protein
MGICTPKLALLAIVLATAAACRPSASDQNIMIDNNAAANADIELLPPDESSAANVANGAAPAVAGTTIPAAFHGRWGMVEGDCTSTRGDAKGLITVAGDTITFYESRARLTRVTQDTPEKFTGEFAFTGEGQTWTKTQNLKLTGSSNTLIRTEIEPSASFTYRRCR